MTVGQGTIYTASDVKNQLRESNRNYKGVNIWDKLYSGVSLQEQAMTDDLTSEYASAMNQAYLSSIGQKQAILDSNMGQGFKERALDNMDLALDDAFSAYRQNYLSGLSSVQAQAQESRSQIDALLNEYSTNVANYGNAHFEYIDWLYKNHQNLFDDGLTNLPDWVMSDDGVKSLGEITSVAFDENGNLTDEGYQLFQLLDAPTSAMRGASFGDYLASTNPELYNWATSTDPYNFNANGTGAGTFYQQNQDRVISDDSTNDDISVSAIYNDGSVAQLDKGGSVSTTNNGSVASTNNITMSGIKWENDADDGTGKTTIYYNSKKHNKEAIKLKYNRNSEITTGTFIPIPGYTNGTDMIGIIDGKLAIKDGNKFRLVKYSDTEHNEEFVEWAKKNADSSKGIKIG